ncbi:MAG: 3'-5' exonuclease, partial [Lepagella sp.]
DDWEKRKRDLPILQKIGAGAQSITAFLGEYVLDPALETGDKEDGHADDHVILTTIHSAKGLEATNCYLLNVSYSNFPSPHAVEAGEEAVEEERRCLYVALTRAKNRLYLYRSLKASRVVEPSDRQNSLYFLNDLPPHLCTLGNVREGDRTWSQYKGEGISFSDDSDFDFS